jgi:DNA-binding transcriptional regulator LsrR (DeoR family)
MYYIQDKTQKEISEALGLSRSGVSRLLAAAKRQGIVRISVVNPAERATCRIK